ncbi:MAG TPA: YhjD/YihY/BrkB family envelope integrity protein, partial [Novosphingobium sp.]|nr:YhjD/YihY/BrkB family envelope integrity protein [Novosphingobium sp.]
MRGGGPAGSHARAGRHWAVARRVVASVWRDGFIHAGNLAYMAILALFPFFVVISALFTLVGEGRQRAASVDAFLAALPPVVAQVLDPVGRAVIDARHGWLLWAGGLISLWTVSSLIETLRDILRRAYGITPARAFWLYRLISTGMIMGAVVMLLVSLYAQVVMST